MFEAIMDSGTVFDLVLFCPPGASYPGAGPEDEASWESQLGHAWGKLDKAGSTPMEILNDPIVALARAAQWGAAEQAGKPDVLVTGSLFLVGKAIQQYATHTLGEL
eukprot:TRINITY_DN14816_c0_g1_i5.p3 TRINITY_DN14816_c0_g1~~TRINITY_DN14816_c0_g1_i5.p3  ORF type:complete len:106 (+),score=18.75 TRINITY_DN14816_c0_g1_i5:1099-1416(+)